MVTKKKNGFTLIELLVVISTIGLLSSFAVVQLNDVRIKARDALRKGDTTQLRTALQLYYDDNSVYPACGTWTPSAEDLGATTACYNQLIIPLSSRPYLSEMPSDPRNKDNDQAVNEYVYRYVSNGTEYALVYRLEGGSGVKVIRGW